MAAMRYGEGLLEEIRRRTDLVQLVGRRVKLVRKGRVMWGCCPFHAEKSPSFKVENERRAYKCFGCGAGGDAFKWLMETEGLSFPEAVEKLAGEAGVELPKWSPDDEAREQKRKSLYEIVELAAQFYEAQLRETAGREARDYLKGRGLDGAAAKQFRLGYAPASGQALIEFLKAKNVTQDDMIAAGLARPAEDGRPMRDFFFNRVMFPIADGRGRVIAFGGARAGSRRQAQIHQQRREPRSFPRAPISTISPPPAPPRSRPAPSSCAEGYMDVIALVRAGFAHAVAPLGTALTDDQLQLLWRTAPEPILAFDGDAAGLKAAHRAAHLALPHLKAGYSLALCLPARRRRSRQLHRQERRRRRCARCWTPRCRCRKCCGAPKPRARIFPPPNAAPGWNERLREIVGQITDAKIADYYRRDFEQKVFESFKRRRPSRRQEPRRQPGPPAARVARAASGPCRARPRRCLRR